MKWIDCSACIGLDSINREIVNHENYYVYEKVRQAEHAADLLEEMDFAGWTRRLSTIRGWWKTIPATATV